MTIENRKQNILKEIFITKEEANKIEKEQKEDLVKINLQYKKKIIHAENILGKIIRGIDPLNNNIELTNIWHTFCEEMDKIRTNKEEKEAIKLKAKIRYYKIKLDELQKQSIGGGQTS